MSSTPMSTDAARRAPGVPAVPMRYEVTVLPVADADRAKAFYEGWAGGSTPTSRSTSTTGSCSSPRRARLPRSSSARG